MSLQVDIKDEQMTNMSENAQRELISQLKSFAEQIIREANLIEDGNREEGANSEITSSMVKLAVRKYRLTSKCKKVKGLIALRIISTFSLLVTGALIDFDGYEGHPVKLWLFIVSLLIASVSTLLLYVKED